MKIRFAFLVLFGMVLPLFAQDTTGKKAQTKPATPIKTADSDVEKSEGQKKLDSIRNEFKKLQDDVIQEYKDAKSPEEAQKLIPKIQQNLLKLPREDFAKKALALSKTMKSSDQGSFDSLVFAMSMVARGSNKEIMKEAVDLIVKDHSKNPKMASVLGFIATSPDGAAILEKIATKTEDRNIAGLAWYAITENLQQQTGEVGIKQAEELNKRTEMIYEKLAKDYADVPMANGRGTIGSTIKAALFELQNLSIGKVAPEVLCLNIDGDKDDKLSNYKGKVVVLDIWATWCGPCKMISPIVDEISSDYVDRIKVGKCDADVNRDKVMELGVRNIPTIFFYKDGQIVESTHGAVTKKKLTEIIDGLLAPAESVDSIDNTDTDF